MTIRGKVAAVEGKKLRITTASGVVAVQLPDRLRVTGAVTAKLSEVTQGSYIGTAARKQPDGTLRALEIHIFPEKRRGTGEGHRPYDLPGTTMTNANVAKVEQVMVEKAQGPMLTLQYKGGEVRAFVPPEASIVRLVDGSRDMIKPGVGVIVPSVQPPDGTLTATRVSVGIGGIMPPM